jgi:hypothetical protein
MSKTDLEAAADHIRDANAADDIAQAKAPIRRDLAIGRIRCLLPLIYDELGKIDSRKRNMVEFSQELRDVADELEKVYDGLVQLSK